MDKEQEVGQGDDTTLRAERRSDGQTDPVRKRESQSVPQMAVFGAMALVVSAGAYALYSEGFVSGMSALFFGVLCFVALVAAHSLTRHYKHTLELAPRIDNVEEAVEGLKGDVSQIGDMRDRFRQLEELAEQVADIQLRLKDVRGDEGISGNGGNDAGILQEVAGLEEEIRGIRHDFECATGSQRQRFDSELHVLQTLIKQVAEQVAMRDRTAAATHAVRSETPKDADFEVDEAAQEPATADLPASGEKTTTLQFAREETVEEGAVPADEGFSIQELEQTLKEYELGTGDSGLSDVVSDAIENNRVELFLQPIVGVEDRKISYYEALTRLRNDQGQLVLPSDYIGTAERSGMMPLIDNIMLFRTVQVIQKLSERESTRGVFCNISPFSLIDPEFFPEFIDFMGENRHLASHLYFEFPQQMIRNAGRRELEALSALAEFGFMFSLDNVTNLNIDFRDLAERSFRFFKLDVRVFLHGMADAGARIHAADMNGYLERYGMQLIIERVEDERSAASLGEYDVALAQGYLFSEPRPVRPEVFGDPSATEAA